MPLYFLCSFLISQHALCQAHQTGWHEIPAPTADNVNAVALLKAELAYLLTSQGAIFRYRDGVYQPLPQPLHTTLRTMCVVADEKIWASGYQEKSYRQQMFYYENGAWAEVWCPNVDDIRTIAFEDSAHGWAGCVWGEILRYQDGTWAPVPTASRLHINKIFFDGAGGQYAVTEHRGRGQVLRWDGKKWQVWLEPEQGEILDGFAFSENDLWLRMYPLLALHWDGHRLAPVFTPKPRRIVFSFVAQNNGYFLADDSLFHFAGDRLHYADLRLQGVCEEIALSPAGDLWLFGENTIMASSAGPKNTTPASTHFSLSSHALGKMKGAAYFEIRPGVPAIYAIEHEKTNLVLPFDKTHRLRPEWHVRLTAGQLGLVEPQRNDRGEMTYDHAVLAADFNNDGNDDLFVSSLYGEIVLFLNSGRGKFFNVTEWAGLAHKPGRYGLVATADVDNDGDLDLFLPNEFGPSTLHLNDGYGRFHDGTLRSRISVSYAAKAAVFGDIDQDGWIDLAVTTFGEGTYLFHNAGHGQFVDVTSMSASLRPARFEKCTALAFADYDNDGDLDLHISKLLASNALLQNDGSGRFRDVTVAAGLGDDCLSRGAAFLDVENDGDLDLYVINMGPNLFYRNSGNGHFRNDTTLFGPYDWSWLPSENDENRYGAYSSGAVIFDNSDDGDLDMFIPRFDAKSVILTNAQDDKRFLMLTLTGVHANRSAIGATVNLYPAGKLRERKALLGTRMIESTSAGGSHAQKLIHFGVEEGRRYDVEISYPGGDRVELRNLEPGTALAASEFTGWQAWRRHALNALGDFVLGYRNWERVLQTGLLLLTFLLTVFHLRRQLWWEEKAKLLLLMALLCGLGAAHLVWVYEQRWAFVTIPLVSAAFCGALCTGIWRWLRIYKSPHASIAALSLKLAAFAHSTPLANLMTALDLQIQNLPAESEIEADLGRRFLQTVQSVRSKIGPEIQTIVGYQYAIAFEKTRAAKMARRWRRFSELSKRLEDGILERHTLKAGVIAQVRDDLHSLRRELRELRRIIALHESTDVIEVISSALRDSISPEVQIIKDLPQQLPPAFIPAVELRTIITELITNAERAMSKSQTRQLQICAFARRRLHVECTDTGCGIAPADWDRVFERSYSTRHKGGFGLFYAKKVLEQYRGEIGVKESVAGKGSTFFIILEKAKTDHHETGKVSQAAHSPD